MALSCNFSEVFGLAGMVRVISTINHIEKQHPKEPHYYLQAIGTDPKSKARVSAAC